MATNAKQVSTAFGENTVWLLGLLAAWWAAWLVGCLDLWKTHTVMGGSWTGRKMLVRWLLGLLAVVCLHDTVLDGYANFSACVLG